MDSRHYCWSRHSPTRGASTEPGRLVDVPPSAQRAELAECDIVAGELPDPGPGVFQPPHSTDAPIIDSDEGDFVDVHAPTGGCDALPLGRLGARAAKVRDDSVAFLDELDDLLVPVGERREKLLEGGSELGRKLVGGELVEHVKAAGVDDVVDESVHEPLVEARGCRPRWWSAHGTPVI